MTTPGDSAPVGDEPILTDPEHAERVAVGFCRGLRQVGVVVPVRATLGYVEALGRVGLDDPERVYWSGRATLIGRPEDVPAYDAVFASYWRQRWAESLGFESAPQSETLALDLADEDESGDEEGSEGGDEVEAVRFSAVEVLTEKDFGDCTEAELAELSDLLRSLSFTTHNRRSRRRRPARRRGDRPDLRRTVRRALEHQGEPVERAFTEPSTRPRRLVLLLDVSGSMEAYARALLRFAHAAVVARQRVEVFTLGTRLTRVSRQLSERDPDAALRRVTPDVKDWSGGTRLGDGIRRFNDEWGIRGLARGSVVVVLSDGWDRGDPAVLGDEMARLARVTHRLVWVNPLKATPGYAPLAGGMAAALPHLDAFVEGHNYRSLAELADFVALETAP